MPFLPESIATESRRRAIWLRVGQLIDGFSDAPLRDADLVFDAKTIRFVGSNPPREHLAHGQSEPDAILPEATALPCLIEAHAHLFLDGAPVQFEERDAYLKKSPDFMLERAKMRLPRLLEFGVGAVRDAGDKHGVGLALAKDAKTRIGQLATMPYLDSPGPAIYHRGRYGSFMGEPIEDHASPEACVAARVAAGADRIKLLATGIINFQAGKVTTPPQMSGEEIAQFVAAARTHGKQTFAHASGSDGIENCIEGGVTTIEHGFFITEEQLRKMRDRQIAWVPTFAPVQLQIDQAKVLGWSEKIVAHLQRIIDSHQQMLRRAHELGVTIVAGSDAGSCGVPHGLGLLAEMEQMERAGVPAMSVIRSATGISSGTLTFPEPIGQLKPGHRARFIISQNDPLITVANLQHTRGIWFDGTFNHASAETDARGL
jgi:imidazolonepropionase-like amidohydrolase